MRSVVSMTCAPVDAVDRGEDLVPVVGVAGVDRDVAHDGARRPRRGRRRRSVPPASPIAPATRPSMPGRSSISTRMVRLYCADGRGRHGRAAVYVAARAARVQPAAWSVLGARARRALPDRRQQPRLPRVLRAARVDRDLDGPADERDLRLRLDAREDPHRVRAEADDRRAGTPGSSGRKEVYAEYKAQRTSRPDLLKEQWPHLEPLVEAFGYRNVSVDGLRGRRRDRHARRAGAQASRASR